MVHQWHSGPYTISTDKQRVDIATVHSFLSTRSYWAEGIPVEIVERSIEHSLVFGIYKGEQQIGFARIITDYATFAYLGDVFVLEPFRGQGLSKWLVETIVSHPQLQGFRRWALHTRDAHTLYARVGFSPTLFPERYMERNFPDIYRQQDAGAEQVEEESQH